MQRLRKLICKFVVFEDLNSGNSLECSEKSKEDFNCIAKVADILNPNLSDTSM